MVFKYQQELDFCIKQGCKLPLLHALESQRAFRFVFSDDSRSNHVPPHKLHPNRLKQQINVGRVDISGFALSNLETEDKAIEFYDFLRNNCPNIKKQIGDSLSSGTLVHTDGMITDADSKGHFDLYESDTCDLSQTFTIIKSL